MSRIAPISPSFALVPRPGATDDARADAAPAASEAPAPRAAHVPTVWTLGRETAAAALSAQMMGRTQALRRGLKADPVERARYVRAYAADMGVPAGLLFRASV